MNMKKITNIKNNSMRLAFSLLFMTAFLAAGVRYVEAVGKHLDRTFNGSGLRNINLSGSDFAEDVAIQADGKIVVVGTANGGTSDVDFAVARLNPNGLLDTTFNTNGFVVTPVLGTGLVYAVAIQTNGKIIVAGSALVNGFKQFCLARYNTNGSLDTTFDANGIVYTLINPFATDNASVIQDIAVQPDGKIVAIGTVEGKTSTGQRVSNWAITRYNTNGSLDTTLDGDGILITSFGSTYLDSANSVIIQPDGKILAAGGGENSGTSNFALARYNTDGGADFSFGNVGKVMTAISSTSAEINDIELQPDGKIVAGGSFSDASPLRARMARYHSNGTLDTTFGNGGIFDSLSYISIKDLAIQADGKIICATFSSDISEDVFRVNPNGSYDAGFGRGGRIYTEGIAPTSMAIQSDGKIVVAGRGIGPSGTTDFFVVRYLPEMGKPFDFDGDGKTEIGIYRRSAGEWWINGSRNNVTTAVQFGQFNDILVPADYTGDGKSDIAFYRSGMWFVLRSEDSSFYAFPFGSSSNPPDIPAPGDFDGDGKTDPTVFRPSNSTWYVLRSSDNQVSAQQFGASADIPVVADYDGDGKSDIAIIRKNVSTNTSEWWILRSTDGLRAVQFGTSSVKAVPGDYTGDGKADAAFYSGGTWSILRSENQTYYAFPFGLTNDTPVPGDYDGDGRADAAVFRPSSADWFIQGSTSGAFVRQFGLSTDLPIPNVFVR